MYKFDAQAIPALTEDTRAAIAAADEALLTNSRMFITIVENVRKSDLPINVTQDLYGGMLEGAARLLAGRDQLRKSITIMQAIANQSRHKEEMVGCPLGFPSAVVEEEMPGKHLKVV